MSRWIWSGNRPLEDLLPPLSGWSHSLQEDILTYFLSELCTLLTLYPLHKLPDGLHLDLLQEQDRHLHLLQALSQAQKLLLPPGSDKILLGSFHLAILALWLHRRSQIQVPLKYVLPEYSPFREVGCIRSLNLCSSGRWHPGGWLAFWVPPCRRHQQLLRSPHKVPLLLPLQGSSSWL